MAALIVGFPPNQRRISGSEQCLASIKAVRFSRTSWVLPYKPHPKSERRDFWYSKEDFEAMKKDFKRHAFEMRTKLSSLSSETVCAEGFDVFGMENLMSEGLVERRVRLKRLAIQSVLQEQARQYLSGYDPDLLAEVSGKRSKWARDIARSIGLPQLELETA